MGIGIALAERGFLPEPLVILGMRMLIGERAWRVSTSHDLRALTLSELMKGPISTAGRESNAEHYEVPTEFFKLCLGPRMKYSSCYFIDEMTSLSEAEEDMIDLTMRNADLHDGQHILELGCGWGSLTIPMAEKYPNTTITAVSHSHSQRRYIESEAERRGLTNISVITADINLLSLGKRFHRIVSVEMFEHLRNWKLLFEQLPKWLFEDGKLFVHVFTHKDTPYLFEVKDDSDWMAKHFFQGGIMPSRDLVPEFGSKEFSLEDEVHYSGIHYAQTAYAWLANLDANKAEILRVLSGAYGSDARLMFYRWRLFFLAVAECFGWEDGSVWGVSHYLLKKR